MPDRITQNPDKKDLVIGDHVTWTEEGIQQSYKDSSGLDAALVVEGANLEIVAYDKNGVVVKNERGETFPANMDYLKKI